MLRRHRVTMHNIVKSVYKHCRLLYILVHVPLDLFLVSLIPPYQFVAKLGDLRLKSRRLHVSGFNLLMKVLVGGLDLAEGF